MQHLDEVIWRPTDALRRNSYAGQLQVQMGADSPHALWKKSVEDLAGFWDLAVRDCQIEWFQPYTRTFDSSAGLPWTRWFVGGKLNIAHNCVDRHRDSDHVALLWEGDDGEERPLTYRDFADLVGRAAAALEALGVAPGDAVGILMPMLPETVIAMFACFKVGAVAVPVFSAFGADAVRQRFEAAKVKVVFTADGGFRGGKRVDVKKVADEATRNLPVTRIVFRRTREAVAWDPAKDRWWNDFVLGQAPLPRSVPLDSEAPCLYLFSEGSSGKPKGAVHTHAGALATIAKEHRYAFNVDGDARFFWLADIGSMLGPWEMIGVTHFRGTLFLFEGPPDYPTPGRLWDTLARQRITHLGLSPSSVRHLMKFGENIVRNHRLGALQYLGSTGETWDPDSYLWFFKHVGGGRCPVVNFSGGTSVLGSLLSPLPIHELKPCSLGSAALGVDADVFDDEGKSLHGGIGHLVVKQPIPSMTRGFLGETERYLDTYFRRFPGVWNHGDWAHVDRDHHWFLHGRSDDTLQVCGKRLGPTEFESLLLDDPLVSEVAVVAVPDESRGEAPVAFVVLKPGAQAVAELGERLESRIVQGLGRSFALKALRAVSALPKSRSGKIIRSLTRKLYLGEALADTSSVENPDALEAIRKSKPFGG
jgi:acetyl-CoA synthetase